MNPTEHDQQKIEDALLVTVNKAARTLGVTSQRLRFAIRDGELPAFAIGAWLRVRLRDVRAWIETKRVALP